MARGMRVQGTSKSTCQLSNDSTWLFGGLTEQQIRDCLIHKKDFWGCGYYQWACVKMKLANKVKLAK